MNPSRFLTLGLLLVALHGCATPPGTPVPKPTDYQELSHAEEVFKRWSLTFRQDPDVVSVFMSSNNNPRKLIVYVRNEAARMRLGHQYGGTIEGLDTYYYLEDDNAPGATSGGPIQAVPKVEAPTTWWGKLMAVLGEWRSRMSSAAPGAAPASPAGSVRQI